jgi:hypothetical protein
MVKGNHAHRKGDKMETLNTDALETALNKIAKIVDGSESDALLMRDMLAEVRRLADLGIAAFDRRNFPSPISGREG